jgi:hypothetical protein
MKVIHGMYPEEAENPTQNTNFKTCPVCGALCFSDMDTCYGCLYQFDDAPTAEQQEPCQADKESLYDGSQVTNSANTLPTKEDGEDLYKPANTETDSLASKTITEASKEVHPKTNTPQKEGCAKLNHICANKEGQHFEIDISIKML